MITTMTLIMLISNFGYRTSFRFHRAQIILRSFSSASTAGKIVWQPSSDEKIEIENNHLHHHHNYHLNNRNNKTRNNRQEMAARLFAIITSKRFGLSMRSIEYFPAPTGNSSRLSFASDDDEMIAKNTSTSTSSFDNNNFSVDTTNNNDHPPTLVILCGWLAARGKDLNKFVQLYHRRQIDVLRIETTWFNLFLPTRSVTRDAAMVARLLDQACTIYPNIVFHTLSSGVYFYASIIDVVQRDAKLSARLLRLRSSVLNSESGSESGSGSESVSGSESGSGSGVLRGVVHDSLVDTIHVFSDRDSFCGNGLLHPVLARIAYALRLNRLVLNRAVVDFVSQRNAVIRENVNRLPGLIFASQADRMADLDATKRLSEKWRTAGIDVTIRCWSDAPHVRLYGMYPREYSAALDDFLKRILFRK